MGRGVTVDEYPGTTTSGVYRTTHTTPIERERIMPRLDFDAVRAAWRLTVHKFDAWTLQTLNAPAGGRRPRL